MIRSLFFPKTKKAKLLLVLIGLELIIVLAVLLFFLRSALSAGNVNKYADSKDIPVVTASDGLLEFNNVRVIVPDKNATYVIGYDWAKSDKDYPSIPSSASAYYTGDEDQTMYEVLLYRDKVTPKKKDGKKYSLDMWFDEWKQASKGNDAQEAYKTPDTKGFLIKTGSEDVDYGDTDAADADAADDSGNKNTYRSYTYYFAVETDSDVEQYVFELNCYDPKYYGVVESIFKECADSIHTGSEAHS